MIAVQDEACDLRILGTSPNFSKDYFVNSVADYCPTPYYEEEIAAEVNVQCVADFDDRDFLYSGSTSANTSCGTSVTSDYSEDSYIDNDDEDFDPFVENENTTLVKLSNDGIQHNSSNSNAIQTLQQNEESENSDTDDTEILSFNEHGEYDIQKTNLSSRKSECSCCELRTRMASLSWSKMSSKKQMESIEYLTRIVSTTLGLREQLDIIRIISPDANVASTDTEFFIDLDTFNDDKFQRLKHYVSGHVVNDECCKCSESRQKKCQQTKNHSSSHHKYSKKKTQKPLSTKKISKKSRNSKGLLARIHRQVKKEERSGLFSKEEVVSVSRKPTISECEEEVEVDILC